MPSSTSLICPGCGKVLEIESHSLDSTLVCTACGGPVHPGFTQLETDIISPTATPEFCTDTPDDAPQEWDIGTVLLNLYAITDVLGEGGMGKVYKAHHLRWDIDLAVKCPKPHLIRNSRAMDAFQQECETWVNLGLHPHITSCYYIRRLGGLPRIFAEYVDGGSLRKWITKGYLYRGGLAAAFERILTTAIQIAWGLHHAHESGLVHRDVKSGNVLMTRSGTAKVTDFGLASARIQLAQFSEKGSDDLLASAGGMTPAYCSPEQFRHEKVSRKTDIWSWALCVLEMMAGGVTWKDGPDAPSELERIAEEGPSQKGIPLMPRELAQLLAHCCSEDVAKRPDSMLEVVDAVRGVYADVLGRPCTLDPPPPLVTRVESLNNRAVSLMDLGNHTEAERALVEALRVEPQHAEATFNLGLILWRTGRWTDEALVQRMREIVDTQAGELPRQLLAQVHLERGDCQAVLDTLREDGDDPSPLTAQLIEYAEQNKTQSRKALGSITAHADTVNAIQLSPKGNFILTGSADNTVKYWDAVKASCIQNLQGHSGSVEDVVLRPDGSQAISVGRDRTIRLWDIEQGEQRAMIKHANAALTCVSASSDFAFAAAGGQDGKLIVWLAPPDDRRRITDAHPAGMTGLAGNKTAELAVSCGRDGWIKLWDLNGTECLRKMECSSEPLLAVAMSPGSRYALVGGCDHLLRLIELESGACIRTLRGHSDDVTTTRISADGQYAVSGSKDGTVRLWNLRTGSCIRTYRGHRGEVHCVDISATGRVIASGGEDHTVRLWRTGLNAKPFFAPMVLCRALHSETAVTTELAFAKRIEAAKQALAQRNTPQAAQEIREARSISGFRRNVAAMTLWWRLYRRLPRGALAGFWEGETIKGHVGNVRSLDISWDGRFLVSGGADNTIRLWDSVSGKCLRQFEGHSGGIQAVRFTKDIRGVVSASGDGTVKVWDTWSGKCTRTFQEQAGGIEALTLSPDEQYVATSGWTITLWDMARGRNLRSFGGQTAAVFGLAWSPDGRYLISGTSDEEVRVWDVVHGDCVQVLGGHNGAVSSISMSADSRYVLTASSPVWGRNGELILWETEAWSRVRTFEGHTGAVNAAVISLDGRFALSGGSDGTVRFWRTDSGQCLRVLSDSLRGVRDVQISPDCRYAAAADESGLIQLWILDWMLTDKPAADWDPAAGPYLDAFLERQRPYAGSLPEDGYPDDRELTRALSRKGKPNWTENEAHRLLYLLGCAGFGWIDPNVVQLELETRRQQTFLGWLGSRFGQRRS